MSQRELPDSAAAAAETSAEVAQALRALRVSVERSNEQVARLTSALEAALAALATQAGRPAAGPAPAPAVRSGKRAINWVIGPPDNIGWAYGNNAKRLGQRLGAFDHAISGDAPADIAVYFDAVVAQRYPVEARKSVLRIGGPRPLDRLFGDDIGAMATAFKKFDAVIALNGELFLRASRAHANVHLIPNGLDLKEWSPGKRKADDRPFTVGFAASLKSSAEAEVKGYELAKAATARAGVRLLQTSKGTDQIPHDRMIPDFYAKIDVLIAPVAPGREGTSNVIMEALALGIPVITTPHAGFHGEFLVDRKNALLCDRDELLLAEAISSLQRDERLRRKLGNEARLFAERHHDLTTIAKGYAEIFNRLISPPKKRPVARPKVAFVPFWEPMENFGSSRLRAKYPAEYVARTGRFDVVIGYAEDADIVVVVQMCSDQILERLNANPNQFVIYDVCDKYYENPRVFKHLTPPVSSIDRFGELVQRANLVTVPSKELKAEIASRAPGKAVRFVPEPIDYGVTAREARKHAKKVVLWFGNPDRGNFESARWMIDRLRTRHGYEPLIISRTSFFKAHPDLLPFCKDWSPEAMEEGFSNAGICVVAYHDAEQAKSPNRFISAMMHGVPTLVSNSPACSELLDQTGHHFADIKNEKDLDRAMAKFAQEGFRELYVKRFQRHASAAFDKAPTAETYASLFENHTYAPAVFSQRPRRVAFVSHNLALGEGAPWSLFELASGLRGEEISPFIFAAAPGPLAAKYASLGVPLEIFDPYAKHMVKVVNTRFEAFQDATTAFLKNNEIEAVVCNTVKSSPVADFANTLGIPSTVIVRESYTKEERFSYFQGDARLAAIRGLTNAANVVFVAETSRSTWADQPLRGRVHVIPNGISATRFAGTVETSQAEARAMLDLPQDGLIALCVGTINARKGQRELMRSYLELPEEVRQRCRIVFLGGVEGSGLTEFNRDYMELPAEMRSRLHVVLATDDVAPYYRAADMFLMNSSSEAYPRSVVEALMASLPVISTKVFGVNEQVRHGASGFLYDFNDMTSWKEYFTGLVMDDALRGRMSGQAQRAFWKLTGHQEMLLAYKSIIARMMT